MNRFSFRLRVIASLAASIASTCALAIAAPAIHPIVDVNSSFLLGGSADGKWLSAKTVAQSLRGDEKYRVYAPHCFVGSSTGTKAQADADGFPVFYVTLAPKRGTVAIGGSWNALPRVPQVKKVTQPVYRAAVAAILKQHGIARPDVRITQILRVDLEGDGEEEVLISATRHTRAKYAPGTSPASGVGSQPGDYSFVAMRKLVGGKLKTIMLSQEYFRKAVALNSPNVLTIAAVLDLNGDGKQEVVVHERPYESIWTSVYEVRGERAARVFRMGVGS